MSTTQTVSPKIFAKESAQVLQFLRATGTEEQQIAYAVLVGMRLQKTLCSQNLDATASVRNSI